MPIFNFSRSYCYPCNQVFDWHKRQLGLERLTPPWDKITVLNREYNNANFLVDGKISLKQEIVPFFNSKWNISHQKDSYKEGKSFEDKSISGPTKKWIHTHSFKRSSYKKTLIEDKISFSHWVNLKKLDDYTVKSMEKSFKYRGDILEYDLANLYKNTNGYYVLITGSTGLVGSALLPLLNSLGYKILSLKYNKNSDNKEFSTSYKKYAINSSEIVEVDWNPYSRNTLQIPDYISKKIKFVVNLSGDNILGLWTKQKKQMIFDSRKISTRSLLNLLESNCIRARCCVHASAIGYYGSNKQKLLDELNSPGPGFLAETTKEWEKEQNKFQKITERNINLRIGAVLSRRGGLVKQVELPFRAGLAGYIGEGENFINWILLEDLVRIIEKCISTKSYTGPINAVSPVPIKSKDFFQLLSKKYGSRFFIKVPAFIPKLISKDLVDEIILSNQKISCRKLLKNNYNFFAPTIKEALDNL